MHHSRRYKREVARLCSVAAAHYTARRLVHPQKGWVHERADLAFQGRAAIQSVVTEFIANPYPSYHLLRETEPMHYMPLGLYVASRHADIATILRDKRFGKDFIGRMTRRSGLKILEEPVYRSMSYWMLQLDPPDHGRLRSLVVRAFSARRIEDMRSRIQAIVDGIIDRVEARDHMDPIADFAYRLPVTVICDMLGIPE